MVSAGLAVRVGAGEARAQQVILCPCWSSGGAYSYGSAQSCPIPVMHYLTSTLRVRDPYLNQWDMWDWTAGGGGPSYYDATFGAHDATGQLWVQGEHYMSAPGWSPGYAISNYFYWV